MAGRLKQAVRSKWFGLSFKIGLSFIAFYFVFKGIDFSHLAELIRQQELSEVVVACALIGLQITLGGLRWRLVVVALSQANTRVLSYLEALKLYYISVFFNCCLPGTVGGDVVRVWLAKSEHIPLQISINSVIIDRLIALVALMILVLSTSPILGDVMGIDITSYIPIGIALLALGITLVMYMPSLFIRFEHIKVIKWLMYPIHFLRTLFQFPLVCMLSLIYALLSHLCFCACIYALALSMGVQITLLQCIAFVPLVMLITTLPISIGGWGIREASMVGMLGLVGVQKAAALALSVEIGVMTILISLPAAFLWVAYRKKTVHPLQESI